MVVIESIINVPWWLSKYFVILKSAKAAVLNSKDYLALYCYFLINKNSLHVGAGCSTPCWYVITQLGLNKSKVGSYDCNCKSSLYFWYDRWMNTSKRALQFRVISLRYLSSLCCLSFLYKTGRPVCFLSHLKWHRLCYSVVWLGWRWFMFLLYFKLFHNFLASGIYRFRTLLQVRDFAGTGNK